MEIPSTNIVRQLQSPSAWMKVAQTVETITYEEILHFQEGRGPPFSLDPWDGHAVFIKLVTRYNAQYIRRLLGQKGFVPQAASEADLTERKKGLFGEMAHFAW